MPSYNVLGPILCQSIRDTLEGFHAPHTHDVSASVNTAHGHIKVKPLSFKPSEGRLVTKHIYQSHNNQHRSYNNILL